MDALSIKAPKQPYILMRYRIEPFGVVKHVWEVMTRPEPEARGNIPLSEKQARLFIDEHGLVPLSSDDDNAIYGTPDEAFRKKWAGYFAKEKERIRMINRRCRETKSLGLASRPRGRSRKNDTAIRPFI